MAGGDIVEGARRAKRLLNGFAVLGIAALVFLSFLIIEGWLFNWLTFLGTKGALPEARLWFFVDAAQLYAFSTLAAAVFMIVRFVEGRKIRTLGFRRARWFREYAMGMGVGAGMVGAVVLALNALGCVALEYPSGPPAGLAAAGSLAVFFLGYVVQGAAEEVVSRGWILTSVSARHSRPWGVALSTLFFVACHALNRGVSPMAVVNLALFGVFESLTVFRTDSLWGACGFHSAWNFALGNLFGLDVSGLPPFVTVLDLKTRGSALLTGGAFGPEAGLPVSAALSLGILWLLFTARTRIKASGS
jgi:hypothetical protein